MSKKKIFKIGVISILVFVIAMIAVFFKPLSVKDVKLSFDVTVNSENTDVFQIYYLNNEKDNFSEENSRVYGVLGGEKQTIEFDLENMHSIRLDFGHLEADYKVENMKFSMGLFSVPWTEADWNCKALDSGVEYIESKSGVTYVMVNNNDPYIIWELDDLGIEKRFEQALQMINIGIKLVTVTVLLLVLYVIVKKFEFFVEFPTEIWRSRGILLHLAKNDFRTRFAGSYLGIVWAFIQPIVTVFVYWFVFEKGLRSGAMMDVPFVLWLIAGLVPWFFFSDALSGGTNALVEYQYLVKKVVFQINILPLVKVISNFFVHIVFLCFTLVLYTGYGYFPDLYTLQVFYYSFCLFVLVLGLCYATSALLGFFRDLSQIISIILQVGVWMTPIMWSMETMDIPEGLKVIFKANPLYYIVSGYRDALIHKVWFWENAGLTVYFWVVTVIVLGAGMIVFKRLKPHFADVL